MCPDSVINDRHLKIVERERKNHVLIIEKWLGSLFDLSYWQELADHGKFLDIHLCVCYQKKKKSRDQRGKYFIRLIEHSGSRILEGNGIV